MTLVAYHNDPAQKAAILAQLQAHHDADQIVKGRYWEAGKGCAVGCTIHSGNHAEYEARFGIPQMLARLEDTIFGGLPNARAKEWPIQFMSAIRPGADLSRVGWKWLEWLMLIELDYVRDETVRACLAGSAAVVAAPARGEPIDRKAAAGAAEAAAGAAGRWAAAAGRWAEGRSKSYERMADKLLELLADA